MVQIDATMDEHHKILHYATVDFPSILQITNDLRENPAAFNSDSTKFQSPIRHFTDE